MKSTVNVEFDAKTWSAKTMENYEKTVRKLIFFMLKFVRCKMSTVCGLNISTFYRVQYIFQICSEIQLVRTQAFVTFSLN